MTYQVVLTGTLFTTLSCHAAGQDSLFAIKGNVALTSNYLFRGFTQTDNQMAIQGGLDLNLQSGAYLSLWGSNVKFLEGETIPPEDRASMELDIYAGYGGDLGNGLSYGLKVGRYLYPGANSDLNYEMTEFNLSLNYTSPQGTGLGLVYDFSPEFSAKSGKAHHYSLTVSQAVQNGLSMKGFVGQQTVTENDNFGHDDYLYYGLSLNYSLAGMADAAVGYSNTDLDEEGDLADDKVFFTLSKTF